MHKPATQIIANRASAPPPRPPERTSVEAMRAFIPGQIIMAGDPPAWKSLPALVCRQPSACEAFVVPAISEPHLAWIIEGRAFCEEREPGGTWCGTEVGAGMFFLTVGGGPYEFRWRRAGARDEPLWALHLFLPLPVMRRAINEIHPRRRAGGVFLRDASGFTDPALEGLMKLARAELERGPQASAPVVSGLACLIALHLARTFAVADDSRAGANDARRASRLPAFKLKRCLDHMAANLAEPLRLGTLAGLAGMGEFHFSRLFKRATGMSPGRRLLGMRMARARQLLRESDYPVIRIGLETGFSTPSHFAKIFRRENGCSASDYRRES